MEQEILQTLEEIRGIMFTIAVFVAIGILFLVLRLTSGTINQFQQILRRKWTDSADDLFNKGEYHKLIELCNKRLINFPNDATAIWWLARGHKELKEYSKAKELFIKVGEMEPSWKSEYVDPFLENAEVIGSPAKKID